MGRILTPLAIKQKVTMAKKETRIDPDRWYTLTDLVAENLFPWCGEDIRRYRGMVQADQKGDNHLKAVVIGKGFSTRYQIKGKNIIQFIAQFEEGKVNL